MVIVLFYSQGIMGTREFSVSGMINFFKTGGPIGWIKRKRAAKSKKAEVTVNE